MTDLVDRNYYRLVSFLLLSGFLHKVESEKSLITAGRDAPEEEEEEAVSSPIEKMFSYLFSMNLWALTKEQKEKIEVPLLFS